MKITVDEERALVTVRDGEESERSLPLASPEAFDAISRVWLRCGWDTKYVYGFSWLGRPIIQLPEDLLTIQEALYEVKPDVIVETGVAHGGSLVFYAHLCLAMGRGRVVGVDVDIRPHNRAAIEAHELSRFITLIQGSSTDETTVQRVAAELKHGESVIVILDSNHSKEHVLKELNAYSKMVSVGSYIVACDGIMKQVVGAPRTQSDWGWNNPIEAVAEFLSSNDQFELVEPPRAFNEGAIHKRVTYWPGGFLRRRR